MRQASRARALDHVPFDDSAVTLGFRLDRNLAEAVQEAAAARGSSVETWLRDVVRNAVRQRRRAPRNVRMSRRVTTTF
jgi:plasmid stability protein